MFCSMFVTAVKRLRVLKSSELSTLRRELIYFISSVLIFNEEQFVLISDHAQECNANPPLGVVY